MTGPAAAGAGIVPIADSSAADEAEGQAAIPFRSWATMGVLLLLTIFSYVDRTIISLLVEPIKRDLHVTDVQISLLQGFAFATIYALATVPMGWLSDRMSRRFIIAIGVAIWSLATVCSGFTRNFAQLFVARFGVGIGEAALAPSAYGIVAEIFPKRRLATAIGVLGAGTALGASLAYILGGVAISWGRSLAPSFGMTDWQFVFLLVGLAGLACLPLLFIVPRSKPASARVTLADDGRDYREWLRRHGIYVVLLALGVGCLSATMYAASAWVPSFFVRTFALDVASVGVTIGIIHIVTGLIGFMGAGWLADRLHLAKVREAHFKIMLTAIASATICGMLCFGVAPTAGTAFVLLGLLYLTASVLAPAIAHLQLATPPRFHGRTIALYQLIMNLFAMILGPSSAALFAQTLFGGPEHIGKGLAMTFLLFGPLGLALIATARTKGRRALHEAEAERGSV